MGKLEHFIVGQNRIAFHMTRKRYVSILAGLLKPVRKLSYVYFSGPLYLHKNHVHFGVVENCTLLHNVIM
jgi:hypothetical protein